MKKLFHNGTIHTGAEALDHSALVAEDGFILSITQSAHAMRVNTSAHAIDLEGGHLAPAFIDLQIYGANGQLFADHPTVGSIKAIHQYCLEGGAAYFQPTMGTQSDKLIDGAIQAVREYREQGLPGMLGLHLEGPYINPVKRGAHVESLIQIPEPEKVAALLEKAGPLLTMMTLAPEKCAPFIIRMLIDAGVVVSAGHSNATYEEAKEAFALGVPAATHLFNAMSALSHRAPGLAGALLETRMAAVSVVADGYHVDFPVIRIAKRLLGDKLFLITDAVTGNKEGAYPHVLAGDRYILPDGTLSGSALTMMKAVENCVRHADIALDEALRMASMYPARLMGVDRRIGSLAPGMEASLVWFDKAFRVKGVFTPWD